MLEVNNISKSYGKKKALCQVSFTMDIGVYGLLGPNGAGKSTLMSIMTDNLNADTGQVLWNGENITAMGKRFRTLLGYSPQQQGLYEDFTGYRFLSYLAALKDIPKTQLLDEINRVAESVNLSDAMNKRLGTYSGGMKQRILIAQAILGSPSVIILDEPTAGLDPKERVRVRKLLADLARDKVVISATHVVSDIESIAREIVILREGEMIAKDTADHLIAKYHPGGTLEDVYMTVFGEVE